MPTGGFIGLGPTTRSTGNAGANSIYLTAIVAEQNGTATAVLLDTPSATSSISFKALVYDGSHSALLASGSTVTSVAANYNRFPLTSNLSIVAGTTYYVGYVCANTCNVTIVAGSSLSWWASGGQSVTTPANPLSAGSAQSNNLMVALELDGTGSQGFGFAPDQASGVTLSTSNTLATLSATARRGARSVVTQVYGTGKWYAEILVGGTVPITANNVAVGLTAADWGVTQGSTALNYLDFLYPTGVIQTSTTGVTIGFTYASGDVIGIAYDATISGVWFNKNNGSWYGASTTAGNPVAGTGGIGLTTTAWPISVSISTGATGALATFTLRDTAGALQYAPPSGFSAWSAATYPLPAQQYAVSVIVA